jgi:hypothetical protein
MTSADEAEAAFRPIATRLLADPRVSAGTGFGSGPGLRVGTKIFAMVRHGELVVKLPRERVERLVADGIAGRFDPRGDGRLMKEWATVPVRHRRRWSRLADEALAFVG